MKNKTILITGGASGIGLAIVEKFAAEGSRVFFIDFNESEGKAVEKGAREKGGNVTFLHADIQDENQVIQAVKAIPRKLDVLVNNAGIAHIGNLGNTSPADFDRLFAVNVKGLGIQLNRSMCGVTACAATGVFFEMRRMRGAVGA